MPATEVLSAPFKQDSDPQALLHITRLIPTVGKVFSGFVSGKPGRLRAFLDWDSVEATQAFAKSDLFPPFYKDFNDIVDGDFTLWHVEFKPSLQAQHKAQTAPVTEVVTFYFDGMPPAGFVEMALNFRRVLSQQPGFVEVALGMTHQEVPFEGKKGHPVVVLVGWESEQAWSTFANSEEYKEQNPGRSLEEGVLLGSAMEIVKLQPIKD